MMNADMYGPEFDRLTKGDILELPYVDEDGDMVYGYARYVGRGVANTEHKDVPLGMWLGDRDHCQSWEYPPKGLELLGENDYVLLGVMPKEGDDPVQYGQVDALPIDFEECKKVGGPGDLEFVGSRIFGFIMGYSTPNAEVVPYTMKRKADVQRDALVAATSSLNYRPPFTAALSRGKVRIQREDHPSAGVCDICNVFRKRRTHIIWDSTTKRSYKVGKVCAAHTLRANSVCGSIREKTKHF